LQGSCRALLEFWTATGQVVHVVVAAVGVGYQLVDSAQGDAGILVFNELAQLVNSSVEISAEPTH
jgi:hypothetical protein